MNAPIERLDVAFRRRARARARAIRMPLIPPLGRRRLQCFIVLMLGDIAALMLGFMLAGQLYAGEWGVHKNLLLAQILLPVFLTVCIYHDLYSLKALRNTMGGIGRALVSLLMASAIMLFFSFCLRATDAMPRLGFTMGVIGSGALLVVMRLMLRSFVRWRCGASVINQLVIDDGGPHISLPGAYHVSAVSFGLNPSLSDPHALDRIGLVLRNADRVLVSTPRERRADWAIILKGANVEGEITDETAAMLSARGGRSVGGQGLLQVSFGPMGMHARCTKRLLDMSVAISALLVLAPLLVAVAVAIKLEDGGPVLFVQRRLGRGNRFFPIYKFRSMTVNQVGRDGTQSASRTDKRITRIGRLIRSTSIDELPQLLNVLRGDMSLVGPRPHAIGSQAGDKLFWEIDERYWVRHALKPGLTGLAQVRGFRGATDCEADLSGRLNADLEYLHGWSLWRDLSIIMATFRVLVHEKAF